MLSIVVLFLYFSFVLPLSISLKVHHLPSVKSESVRLRNQVNRLYIGPLQIGNTTFNVVFDTGSKDLWVFGSSEECGDRCEQLNENCEVGSICCTPDYMTTYSLANKNPSNSKLSVNYGKGWVRGVRHTDRVGVGDFITEGQVEFGVATSWAPSMVSCIEELDGIFGLGSNANHFFFDQLFSEGIIKQQIWSFWLEEGNEQFIVGPPLRENYKFLHWLPLSRGNEWWVHSEGVGYKFPQSNETSFLRHCYDSKPCHVLIDSGTSFILLPPSQFRKIAEQIRKNRDDCTFDENRLDEGMQCDIGLGYRGLPNLFFNFGGKLVEFVCPHNLEENL